MVWTNSSIAKNDKGANGKFVNFQNRLLETFMQHGTTAYLRLM